MPDKTRMEQAIVEQVKASEAWSRLPYITGRATTKDVDAAWRRLFRANSDLRALAAEIETETADANA